MTQDNPGTAVATSPAQAMSLHPTREFSKQELTLLQGTIAKGLDRYELSLFVQASRHYQLDPFSRQIYAIKRGRGEDAKMTIQISIDGFRVIAERNPDYAGQTPPEFMDRHGNWHVGIWIPEIMDGIGATAAEKEGPYPAAARVGIKRHGWDEPVYGYAAFREYAQYTARGLGDMWVRMPGNQLAKCAESLGLRKAFPNDLSGAYSNEEMGQAPGARNVDIEVEGMSLDELDRGVRQNTDEYLSPGEVLEGEVVAPRGKREKSADELEWERNNPPARAEQPAQATGRRAAAAASPARQQPAPAAAPPPPPAAAKAPPTDRSMVKTVTQLMKWANERHGMDVAQVFAACKVASSSEIQNLGLTEAGKRIDSWLEDRIASEALSDEPALDSELDEGEEAALDDAFPPGPPEDLDPDSLPF